MFVGGYSSHLAIYYYGGEGADDKRASYRDGKYHLASPRGARIRNEISSIGGSRRSGRAELSPRIGVHTRRTPGDIVIERRERFERIF